MIAAYDASPITPIAGALCIVFSSRLKSFHFRERAKLNSLPKVAAQSGMACKSRCTVLATRKP
jgi:hypothetical protein